MEARLTIGKKNISTKTLNFLGYHRISLLDFSNLIDFVWMSLLANFTLATVPFSLFDLDSDALLVNNEGRRKNRLLATQKRTLFQFLL